MGRPVHLVLKTRKWSSFCFSRCKDRIDFRLHCSPCYTLPIMLTAYLDTTEQQAGVKLQYGGRDSTLLAEVLTRCVFVIGPTWSNSKTFVRHLITQQPDKTQSTQPSETSKASVGSNSDKKRSFPVLQNFLSPSATG